MFGENPATRMSFSPKRYRTYTNQKKTGEDPSKGSGLYDGYITIAVCWEENASKHEERG
jgi:hypothetical protein